MGVRVKKRKWYMSTYIHDLLNTLINPIKFQVNQMRTYKFWLKIFDTAVTLKYIQGQWKWYGSMSSAIMQRLTFITFIVSQKITISQW